MVASPFRLQPRGAANITTKAAAEYSAEVSTEAHRDTAALANLGAGDADTEDLPVSFGWARGSECDSGPGWGVRRATAP